MLAGSAWKPCPTAPTPAGPSFRWLYIQLPEMQHFSSCFPSSEGSANIEADLSIFRNCKCRRSLRRIQLSFVSPFLRLLRSAGADVLIQGQVALYGYLVCFQRAPTGCESCHNLNFSRPFVIHFPLQTEESYVSLTVLKRRGTFQGITERGT